LKAKKPKIKIAKGDHAPASPANRLDCTNIKIRSRELYLLIVVVVDGVEDVVGGDEGARSLMSMSSMLKSSMRGGGVFLMTIPRALARRSRHTDAPFGRRAVVEALGAVARRTLPKNLIHLLPVQDHKDEGSGDLLTRSLVHASDRTRVATAAAQ
jgi:hypothetical protein